MRRLTDFEEEIVRRIESTEGIEFTTIIKPYLRTEYKLEVIVGTDKENKNTYSIIGYVKSIINPKTEFTPYIRKYANTIIDIAALVKYLEELGFIRHYSSYYLQEEATRRYFIGEPLTDSQKKNLKRVGLGQSNTNKIIDDVYFNTYIPTQALRQYVKYDCRTDEQKKYDEEKKNWSINKILTIIALVIAFSGTIFSGVYSCKSFHYTKEHDSKRDKTEDDRFYQEHPELKKTIDKKKG